jgi:ABC-type uncharacterized transport system ATPase subunit
MKPRTTARLRPVAIGFQDVHKSFGTLRAVDGITFEVGRGTVHALLGQNGAGKTTLMRILGGLLQPDSGHIELFEKPIKVLSPRDARRLGIGMVHQHLALLPALTVGENLLLDDDQGPAFFRPRQYGESLKQHATRFGLEITPDRPIWQLTMAERQVLEICRVLMRGCPILVLDEPTAHLSPPEGDRLLSQVRDLAREGTTVLLVTHKLREIEAFADEVTVLRDGKQVLTAAVADASPKTLSGAMMGETQRAPRTIGASERVVGEPVLGVMGLSVRGKHGQVLGTGLDFHVARGEVVGVAGISGGGQEELAALLVGLEEPPAGRVVMKLSGKPRIAFIPADRLGVGAPAELSIGENLTLRDYREPGFQRGVLLDDTGLEALAEERRQRFQIRAPGLDEPTGRLSGGNIQRVILARELGRPCDLLIAHNPTSGLDIAGIEFVLDAIRAAARDGAAVVLISDDVDEVLELADRVLVLARGRCGLLKRSENWNRAAVGRLMLGASANAVAAD